MTDTIMFLFVIMCTFLIFSIGVVIGMLISMR